ncbi:hypothetical protein B0H17DRAFT_1139327 [Mycena rosella]|uniref:Uncharacterized protein n=1 Tax=Mycena rosella TaxID=1033263 RepID=A0AAD7D5Y3_MYCRO|nr:hypothetical protein B0H17DRAFT_1139327 [Mycena rosella]
MDRGSRHLISESWLDTATKAIERRDLGSTDSIINIGAEAKRRQSTAQMSRKIQCGEADKRTWPSVQLTQHIFTGTCPVPNTVIQGTLVFNSAFYTLVHHKFTTSSPPEIKDTLKLPPVLFNRPPGSPLYSVNDEPLPCPPFWAKYYHAFVPYCTAVYGGNRNA